MPISFSCPSCSKKLSVPENMAGKAAKCPCGAQLKIPAPANQAVAQQPVAQQPVAAAAQPMPQGNAAMSGNPAAIQNPAAGSPPSNFNPEFKIQCMQCGTEYPMQPHLVGQTVACQCGAPLRFEDPLGTGGLMNANPLGIATAAPLGQPTAYASQSGGGVQQDSKQKQEEDVLRTYLKDEFEEIDSKAAKAARSRPRPGGKMSQTGKGKALGALGFGILALIGGGIVLYLSLQEEVRRTKFGTAIFLLVTGVAGVGQGIWSLATGNELPDDDDE